MKPIGGFFGLEENLTERQIPHAGSLALASGRASFRLVLEQLKPSLVFVPYYTCDALLQPLQLLGIPYRFYALNKFLEPAQPFSLGEKEYSVVINYFGLKSQLIADLSRQYGVKLIIDNTQAYFDGPSNHSYAFNSVRKFFGVPDGSFLYSPSKIARHLEENKAISTDHLIKRAAGDLVGGYRDFLKYEESITCDLRAISAFSMDVLSQANFATVIHRRQSNFDFYHSALGCLNHYKCSRRSGEVPFCYPFLPNRTFDRSILYSQDIFVPTFWKEVLTRQSEGFDVEKQFAQKLLPLPLDHRYTEQDLSIVVTTIKEFCGN